MNFIDVLTRRFLLRSHAALKLMSSNHADDEKHIERITEKRFEMYPALAADLQNDNYTSDLETSIRLQE